VGQTGEVVSPAGLVTASLSAALALGCVAGCSRVATPTAASPSASPGPPAAEPAVGGVVADHLQAPWSMARMPDGSVLVSHRDDATISRIAPDRQVTTVGTVAGVVPGGEGGLLGIAVPRGANPKDVYVYYTADGDNRIARLRWSGGRLADQAPIFTGIPKGPIHDGGRIAFGPDGFLYVGTGETGDGELAQDLSSPAGKILRLTDQGAPAPGNPWPGSPVWTLGHRNVQGLAWDADGRLWASEFGQNDIDELNLIEPGQNYGWPLCEGACDEPGMTNPKVEWSPTAIASPSGMAIVGGSAWVASLRGETLYQVRLRGTTAEQPIAWFDQRFGRLRDVVAGPDGTLWVMTNNTDGRGNPRPADDQILAIRH
jgi:glucose/arabinose dehydrogenase